MNNLKTAGIYIMLISISYWLYKISNSSDITYCIFVIGLCIWYFAQINLNDKEK